MRSIIGILLVTLFSLSSFADLWPTEVHENISTYTAPYDNPYIATAWGTCSKYKKDYRRSSSLSKISLSNDLVESEFPAYLVMQKNEYQEFQRAPLAVYFSGAFRGTLGGEALQTTNWLAALGYNVLVLPDTWSLKFLRAIPKFPMGHPTAEGTVLYKAILAVVEALKADDLIDGGVRFVGLSHGAYLSTVVSALNAENGDPLNLRDVTGLSAPLNLLRTMKKMDKDLNETAEEYNDLGLVQLYKRHRELCKLDGNSEPSDLLKRDIRMLTTWVGFQMDLVDAIEFYDRKIGLAGPRFPRILRGDPFWVVAEFKRSIRFAKTMRDYFPEVLEEVLEKGHMNYWVQRARKSGFQDHRYLIADDDFLNDPGAWNEFDFDTVLVPDGGHYGFRNLSWYKELFTKSFGL